MYINNNITCISPTLLVSHFLPSDIFFCSRDAGTYTFTDTHCQHYMYITLHSQPGVLHTYTCSWNTSRLCVSPWRRGHGNTLLCIVAILVYVLPKEVR